jgi:hypothetical protein
VFFVRRAKSHVHKGEGEYAKFKLACDIPMTGLVDDFEEPEVGMLVQGSGEMVGLYRWKKEATPFMVLHKIAHLSGPEGGACPDELFHLFSHDCLPLSLVMMLRASPNTTPRLVISRLRMIQLLRLLKVHLPREIISLPCDVEPTTL